MYHRIFFSLILFAMIIIIALNCSSEQPQRTGGANSVVDEPGLTDFELEHGIGPIKERIELSDEFDPALIEQGRNIYEMKCEMCHNMDSNLVGPALGDVMERRSAEFVMNFILNPGGMAQGHPVGQELLREYMNIMPYQNVQEDEARAIVEFLREYNHLN